MTVTSEKQPHSTRTQLIQAASDVFSELGLRGATTKEIAKRAGVHETTLFRHFETKELLLKAVIEQMSQEMTNALTLNHQWTDNLHQDLLAYGYIFRDALIKNNALIRTLISEGTSYKEDFHHVMQNSHLSFKDHIISYIEQAKFTGQIRSDLDAQKIGRVFTGMIMSAVLRGDMIENTSQTLIPGVTGVINLEDCLDMLINGIAVQP